MASGRPPDIRPKKLKSFFVKATEDGTLCGADVLRQLSKQAAQCSGVGNTAQRAVAFALESFADRYADAHDPVIQSDDCKRFLAATQQPMSNAVSFIVAGEDESEAVRIIAVLSKLIPR